MANDPWGWYAYQHVGRERLTNYLQNDPQPGNLIEAILTPFRDLEYLHHQLFDMLSIHKATGKGLDAFGEMVKIDRLGRDDATYRLAILAKRFSSGGSGTPEEVKRALKNIVVGSAVRIVDHFPAAFIAQITKSASGIDSTLSQLVSNMAIAGVHGYATFDYGLGGFTLSGVSGRLYNAIGVGPTASGNNDTAMGVNGTDAVQPAAGDIVAPAAGTEPLTLVDANNYSYKTSVQVAHVTLTVGQVWIGKIHREGDASSNAGATVKIAPSASAPASILVDDNTITINGISAGATRVVILAGDGTDTLFISITVADSTVLGVNASYATVGGTVLAGETSTTGQPDAYFFGTYQET